MRCLKLLALVLLTAVCMMPTVITSPSALAATNVYGDVCSTSGTSSSPACQNQNKSSDPLVGPNGVVEQVTGIIAYGAVIAAVIVIIIGGTMYILASGDSANINRAKNTILFAIIGLGIILVAYAIVSFVVSKL